MTPADLPDALAAHGLSVMGAARDPDAGHVLLLGAETALWPVFTNSAEFADGMADPLDRWSRRIIDDLAQKLGAGARYPSDGPPYPPFIRWALDSGQFFQSPVGMLVHGRAGLMISLRGALVFDCHPGDAGLRPAANPCPDCPDKPCTTACPVSALSANTPYDVAACKSYLDTAPGDDCMMNGCIARRACPVSQRFGRLAEQSAHHMAYFHRRAR